VDTGSDNTFDMPNDKNNKSSINPGIY